MYFVAIFKLKIRPKLGPKLRWSWPKLRGSAELNFGRFGRSLNNCIVLESRYRSIGLRS